jgi:hypothetical protein
LPPSPLVTKVFTASQDKPSQNLLFKKIKIIFIVVFLIFGLFISASLALAYGNYQLFKPPLVYSGLIDRAILLSPLPKPPRIVIAEMTDKMSKLRSATSDLSFEITSQDKTLPVKSAKILLSGPIEFQNDKSSKGKMDAKAEIEFEGVKITIAASFVQVGKNLYFKLTEVPFGSYYQLDSLSNTWFSASLDQELTQNIDLDKSEKINQETNKFFQNSFSWVKSFKTEDDSYLLALTPPKNEIEKLIQNYLDILEPKNQSKIEDDLTYNQIAKLAESFENLQIEAEIDKNSYLLKSANLAFDLNIDNLAKAGNIENVTLLPAQPHKLTITSTLKLKDFNAPVIVEVPTDATDLSSYLEKYSKQELIDKQPEEDNQDGPGGFRQLIEPKSTVLGEKANVATWDLQLLKTILSLF